MEAFLAVLEGSAAAQVLRVSRWTYAAVNAAHIFGFALLIGAIMPLNLRFLGLWRSVPQQMAIKILVPVAATGLAIAVAAGFLLFSVRAQEYAGIGFLQIKLALVAIGIVAAVALHRKYGFLLEGIGSGPRVGHAVISIFCWLGALLCGRLIAFAGN